MKAVLLVSLLAIAACETATTVPTTPQASITWGGGDPLFNSYSVTVTVDDRIIDTSSGPFGENAERSERQGRAGIYAELSQVLASQGLVIQTAADPDSLPCEDHGGRYVMADPPVDGFSSIGDDCPGDEAVADFLPMLTDVLDGV